MLRLSSAPLVYRTVWRLSCCQGCHWPAPTQVLMVVLLSAAFLLGSGLTQPAFAQTSIEYAGKYKILPFGLRLGCLVFQGVSLVLDDCSQAAVLTLYIVDGGVAFQAQNGKFLAIDGSADPDFGTRPVGAIADQPNRNATFIQVGSFYRSEADSNLYRVMGSSGKVDGLLLAGPLQTGNLSTLNLNAHTALTLVLPGLPTIQTNKQCIRCDLSQVIFTKATLAGVDLSGANLSQATLDQTNLTGPR